VTRFELPPPHPSVARIFQRVRMTGGHVDVRPDVMEIDYGWAFRAVIPRSSIVGVVPEDGPVWRYGANRRGNLWAVVPDAVGLVRFTVEPPARGILMWFFRGKLRDLRLAVADRDGFLAALGGATGPSRPTRPSSPTS
jgi:hypothetical protein